MWLSPGPHSSMVSCVALMSATSRIAQAWEMYACAVDRGGWHAHIGFGQRRYARSDIVGQEDVFLA